MCWPGPTGRSPAAIPEQGDRSLGDLASQRTVLRRPDHGQRLAGLIRPAQPPPRVRSAVRRPAKRPGQDGPIESPRQAPPRPVLEVLRVGAQEEIVARCGGQDRELGQSPELGEGPHVEASVMVTPLNPSSVTEQVTGHLGCQRRRDRAVTGEGRDGQVAEHLSRLRPRSPPEDGASSRAPEPACSDVQDRQAEMRIAGDRPVAGQVLERRSDPDRLHPPHECRGEPPRQGRGVPEGPRAHDRVARIVEQVGHRGEVDVDAHRRELDSDRRTGPPGEVDGAGRRDRQVARPGRRRSALVGCCLPPGAGRPPGQGQ